MTEFTASNGIKITMEPDREGKAYLVGRRARGDEGQYLDTHANAGPEGTVALREFFQNERDGKLGIWRHEDYPDEAVYRYNANWVTVVDEQSGAAHEHRREDVDAALHHNFVNQSELVARAYFETHPERNPWQDAKPGEVWELVYEQLGEPTITRPFTVDSFGHFRNTSGVRMGDLIILEGRRVWPEGDAS